MDFNWLFEKPIAHRGLHNELLPENSLGAFKNAIEHGYSVEIDVHVTKDGKIVVFHDDDLKRVCGVDKKVKNCTLAELKTYRLKNTEFTIPTFDEFLDLIDGKIGILCEIKGILPWDLSIPKAVVERIKTYKGNIAFQSFNFAAVSYCRKHSDRPFGQLCSWHGIGPEAHRSHISDLLGKMWIAKLSKPQFIAYDVRSLDKKYPENKYVVKRLDKCPVILWTVNNEEKLQTAVKYCNNFIFENLPTELVDANAKKVLPLKNYK